MLRYSGAFTPAEVSGLIQNGCLNGLFFVALGAMPMVVTLGVRTDNAPKSEIVPMVGCADGWMEKGNISKFYLAENPAPKASFGTKASALGRKFREDPENKLPPKNPNNQTSKQTIYKKANGLEFCRHLKKR